MAEFVLDFISFCDRVQLENDKYRDEIGALSGKISKLSLEKDEMTAFYQNKCDCLQEKHELALADIQKHLVAANEDVLRQKEEKSASKILIASLENERNDLKEEISLKSQYIKDLEGSVCELERSNLYFQEQLVCADKTIQELKNNKINLNFAVEIEKIKKKHNKEVALLQLELEKYKDFSKSRL